MGKRLILSLLLVITLVCTIIVIPLSGSGKEAEAANEHPWADLYGFKYTNGFWSAKGVYGYSFYHHSWCHFSGTEEYWNWDYPCTNLSLRYNGWPTTIYCNYGKATAKKNLKNNAIFVFFGHGNSDSLQFWNGSSYSYLTNEEIFNFEGDSMI
jgi:hypothetical protein